MSTSTPKSERWLTGASRFEEVIGFAPPDRGPDFLRLTLEGLFAEVWARDGLPRRDRRLFTLTVLLLSGKADSVALHLRQALIAGELTKKEVEEVMIHLAYYAGWPVGQLGFDVAMKVFGELRAEEKAKAEGAAT
jgi:4-carboxymuconolactone decarboxylase